MEKGKASSKQERTFFSQLTHTQPAYSHRYHHEKAEKFNPVQNSPETPERRSAETDLTSLPEKEFKIKIKNMLMDLQKDMQELKEQVQRETTEIKQSLEGLKSRMDGMHQSKDTE